MRFVSLKSRPLRNGRSPQRQHRSAVDHNVQSVRDVSLGHGAQPSELCSMSATVHPRRWLVRDKTWISKIFVQAEGKGPAPDASSPPLSFLRCGPERYSLVQLNSGRPNERAVCAPRIEGIVVGNTSVPDREYERSRDRQTLRRHLPDYFRGATAAARGRR